MNGMKRLLGATMGVVAFTVWRVERAVAMLETLDPVSDAPGGQHVAVDGLAIHYEARGAGPPIVLIHGFGGSTYSWRFNLPELSRRHRVYALDLPGFGYSERTDRPIYSRSCQAAIVRGFLDVMNETGPAVLVGNSMGGAVALRFAIDYPDRTLGLVLSAPSVFWREPWRRLAPLFRVPWLGRKLAHALYYFALANDRSVSRMLAAAYGSNLDLVTDEVRTALLRPLRVRGSADAALGLARSSDRDPVAGRLRDIDVPVLIVAGKLDQAVSLDSILRLEAKIRRARLVVIEDAGHLIQEEAPDQFNALVEEFCDQVITGSRAGQCGAA